MTDTELESFSKAASEYLAALNHAIATYDEVLERMRKALQENEHARQSRTTDSTRLMAQE